MSFDFVNNNGFQNSALNGAPIPNNVMNGYGFTSNQQQNIASNNQQIIPNNAKPVDPRIYDTPQITAGSGIKFTIKDAEGTKDNIIPVDRDVPDTEKSKRSSAKSRSESSSGSIIRAKDNNAVSGTVENLPTSYTYMETTGLLHQTLSQIDAVNNELMYEFESVKNNRTLKDKYRVLNALSENIGAMINNKISAIREINSSISKSNDLDYKRYKDMQQSAGVQNDDAYISSLYKSFITNNANSQPNNIKPIDMSMYGSSSGIIRADTDTTGNMSYNQYIANADPTTRLMMVENNPNIKQCMVYDANTGNKAFGYYDLSNPANPIPQPGLPCYSDILLDEFTVDIQNKLAKSINMKESMPLIIV